MCCLAGWGLRPGERRPDARTAGQRQARRAQLLRPLLRPRLSPPKMGQSGKASQRKGHGERPGWSKEPALRPPGEGTGPERPEVDRLGVSNTPGSPGPWAGTDPQNRMGGFSAVQVSPAPFYRQGNRGSERRTLPKKPRGRRHSWRPEHGGC
ncbi:uncharacterized protein LOC109493140 isoform X2 [Felis catus]|uniref:uncharacterized protein LOC109493140 isoform X2 n=1 Tax=Felis catus TaxID=9685 RepID=UPI000948702B|nr:uncharacterized protein LOC109493140 isoform X2 [Felis catus]